MFFSKLATPADVRFQGIRLGSRSSDKFVYLESIVQMKDGREEFVSHERILINPHTVTSFVYTDMYDYTPKSIGKKAVYIEKKKINAWLYCSLSGQSTFIANFPGTYT